MKENVSIFKYSPLGSYLTGRCLRKYFGTKILELLVVEWKSIFENTSLGLRFPLVV